MSKGSEAVIAWRKRFRTRIREAMGGKCVICGYDKYEGVLDAHHLNPSEKDFTFGDARANPRALELVASELEKCAMVCKNCHLEIHAGITPSPIVSSFSRQVFFAVTAKKKKKELEKDLCVCGKEKLAIRKFCSVACIGISRKIETWKTIDWTKTIEQIVAENRRSISCIYLWRDKYRKWKSSVAIV